MKRAKRISDPEKRQHFLGRSKVNQEIKVESASGKWAVTMDRGEKEEKT